MIEGLVKNIVVKAKAQTGASEELVLWVFVAALLSVIAIVFLSVAAYAGLAVIYGGAMAGAAVGIFHVLIAAAALTRCIVLRRRTKVLALAEMKAVAKQPAWWSDPGVLAIGLEVAKIIGWRKLAPVVAAGVFAATLSGKRSEREKPAGKNGAH
jgi:hypothetical protein